MKSFNEFFGKMTGIASPPHHWQSELASSHECINRLIRIPTGFGKTLGILATWLWHRMHLKNDAWPRRLVWCLPMRVLVEQTEMEVLKSMDALGLSWNTGSHADRVGVHLLMGGADAGEWQLYPEECAVLIGTQDMLLSRAMNRGYGAPRARWPMEFGLLNQDSLWVMDEVQLMDVGLATSMQLQAFREDDWEAGRMPKPCYTWWMSATLQPGWLEKSPDTISMAERTNRTEIPAMYRKGHLWDDVRKPYRLEPVENAAGLARLVAQECFERDQKVRGPVLVVVNTVDRAVAVYEALLKEKALKAADTDIRLIHSRFRPVERAAWRGEFLNRQACDPEANRVIIATQVVEAGVDISAGLLITELAPWASMVQRFGRSARWGGEATVIIADLSPKDDRAAAPYRKEEIDAARDALSHLHDVAPIHLDAFEGGHPDLVPRLYRFEPSHLLLRHEVEELFDTTPDLSGADIDISRFIRSGEERDLHVFWVAVEEEEEPEIDLQPTRESLCAVPFLKARDWLCGEETKSHKKPRLKEKMRGWVWDWLDGIWRPANRVDLIPGRTVLVAADCGGYDPLKGWSPESKEAVTPVNSPEPPLKELADAALESESLSVSQQWQTVAVHGRETGHLARQMAEKVAPAYTALFGFAGRWHDVGKGHPAFNNSMAAPGKPERSDLAKAPKDAWLSIRKLYPMTGEKRRAGFRHELVSVLAMFALVRRKEPDHPALLGPWRPLLAAAGFDLPPPSETGDPPTSLEKEILDLDVESFDLAAYLICAHHGKARLAWHASPADQAANDDRLRIMGVKDGDVIPAVIIVDSKDAYQQLQEYSVDLSAAAAGLNPNTGRGWTERVLKLLDRYGPFTLAWMEAVFRAADQRASQLSVNDDLLNPEETP